VTTTEAPVGEVTITQRLLAAASAREAQRALIGGLDGRDYTYSELAATVQAAAAGLAWRGLRPRDVVGVHVADAVSYVLATHAIRAAGGVPAPVSAGLTVGQIAWQLAECGARMLLTASPRTAASLAAADRSWVRQVISFGEAAGTIPFSALLGMGSLRPASGKAHDLAMLFYAQQADGKLSPVAVTHVEMACELDRLADEAGITELDVVLAAPPAGDGRAYTAFIDNALLCGAAIVAARADELAEAAGAHHGTAVIVPLGIDVGAPEPLRVFAVA
jgi:acyl-CoA synthetase (AMP-forming)/AMP-acid ligase II